jgi:hypothetical protein
VEVLLLWPPRLVVDGGASVMPHARLDVTMYDEPSSRTYVEPIIIQTGSKN